jgi:hypothetical protein
MNTPTTPLGIGDKVRVTSRRKGPSWVRRGTVEKISILTLCAFVRFDNGGEWIEFERIEVINQ